MRKIKVCLSFAILICLAQAAQAALSITVGTHNLLPNTAGQPIDINITALGGEQMQGVNFRAQLGDGGPNAGGVDITPAMFGDLIGPGTIFETNNNGVNDGSAYPSHLDYGTTTQAGFQVLSPGDNLLITILVDTTGFTTGTWSLHLTDTATGDTNTAGGEDLLIENGSIIIPEPSSIVLGLIGLVGLVAYGRRRKK
jgi:hypothetical protein